MRSLASFAALFVVLGCEGRAVPPDHSGDTAQQASLVQPTQTEIEANWRLCADFPKPSDWDVVVLETVRGRAKSLAFAEAYIATGNPWSPSGTKLKPVIAWTALYGVMRTKERYDPLAGRLNLVTSQWYGDAGLTSESVLRDIRELMPHQELQALFAAVDGRQRRVSVTRSGRREWSARVEDIVNVELASDLGITDLPGPVTVTPSPYGAAGFLGMCRTLLLVSPGQVEEKRSVMYELERARSQNTALQRAD